MQDNTMSRFANIFILRDYIDWIGTHFSLTQ